MHLAIQAQYTHYDSKFLACFLPGCSGAEIKFTVHGTRHKTAHKLVYTDSVKYTTGA